MASEVDPLPFEGNPVIESWLNMIDLPTHVPFSNECRFVAAFLEMRGEIDEAIRDGVVIVDNPVIVRVEPREDRRTARRTKGGRDDSILEVDAFLRDSVEVGSFEERMIEEAERIVSMIVRQDDQEVWFLLRGREAKRGCHERGNQGGQKCGTSERHAATLERLLSRVNL